MAHILLIDDDRNLREVVGFMLEEAGHRVTAAGSAEEALALFARETPDLVLTDVRMSGQDGLAVLTAVRPHGVPVVILTAHGTVRQAVEAMQRGAAAYLLKPFEREELVVAIEKALDDHRLRADNRNLRELLQRRQHDAGLVLRSAAMQRVLDDARRFAASDASVLITGESGTGKELVAQAVHRFSGRYDGPLVAVNCSAIAGELAESELFGHVRGAFTGADRDHTGRIRAAAGGTLFLDEIADLPAALQPKLLRALDQRQVDPVGGAGPIDVDFRLVSATNRDLAAAVREGAFREDLYYRVAILCLHLPPLRERPEDIAPLWDHFTRLHGGEGVRTTPALQAVLEARHWPGNVRELRNLNQRLIVLRAGDRLDVDDLGRADAGGPGPSSPDTAELQFGPRPEDHLSLPELEREVVRRALERCGGNKSKAAKYLGIPRHVLIYRLKKFGP
jgi:DNA-binding NtrC family response regulator